MIAAADNTIVTAFEELGMTPEEIALDQDLDISAVKASLMQFSVKYKNLLNGINVKPDDLDFQDQELREANTVILDLMRYSTDDKLRGKLACYVRDDKKGRLDAKQSLLQDMNNTFNVNVLVFNERLQKAKEARKRAIDVPSVAQIEDKQDATQKEKETRVLEVA